ncbi:MAG TPA: carboxypeptidase-like regulatory domain-containing protein [Bryobacteraceae bacterium]|nr:carboxypeptidase-like regulatory domain-containing protein [Bryobacteraceae bacterium]
MKATSLLRWAVVAVLVFSSWNALLKAQSAGTGALTGTVTDPSGAVVPDVTVTIVNSETNQTRSVTTGSDGVYKFTLLTPGSYKVRFAASGFKTSEVASVTVNVTETPVLDRTLEVGAANEQVTVEATAETLQTASSTLGTVVGQHAVVSLPLTNRNYTQILSLSAGANVSVNNASAFGKGSQDVSVNGANTNQNNYQMDGVNIDNFAGNNLGADAGIYVGIGIPNPDALQEFKIQTSTYDASYGRNPGANVNVVTKSGSNAWHGSLFEFFRNTDLNAVDFFRNRAGGSRQVLNQNQFGGTVGLPIKKDKLFAFLSYQETRQINGVGTNGYSTPTLPPIPSGDRSAAGFQSALGAAWCPANHPGNSRYTTVAGGVQVACDGSNINPVALNFLNLKLPNGSYYIPGSTNGGFQLVPFSQPARFTEHQAVANVDYVINNQHTLSARFFTSQDPQTIPFSSANGELPGTPASYLYANTNAALKLTSILTNTLVNEARLSYQRNLASNSNGVPYTATQLGMTPINPAIPVMNPITIQGLFNVGGSISDDVFDPTDQFQIADTISWSHGRHTIRAGFEAEHINWDIVFKGIERGNTTIYSFPDFLIGRAGCTPGDATCNPANPGNTTGTALSNIASCLFCVLSGPDGIIHGYRANNLSAFVQDDYKITTHLTLNLGVRWEYDGTLSDKYGNLTNVWQSQVLKQAVPGNSPATGSLSGYVVPSNFTGAVPSGVLKSNRNLPVQSGPPADNFAPRFGFAWQPFGSGRIVVRGGVGLFYDRIGGNLFVHSVEQGNPYAVTLDYAGPAAQPASLQQLFPAATLSFIPRWVDFTTGKTSNLNLPFIDENIHTPLVRQYNFGVQWEFIPTWVLDLGYVGSSGINLADYNHNYNTALLASPSNPINGVTTNTVSNANLRVPYLGFAASGFQGTGFDGISNYNSLQVTVRKQLSHGVSVQAAYTWSKSLTDLIGYGANGNDASDVRQQYGPAYYNRPQRFIVNYSWDLPFGHPSGVLGKLAEGWNLSGVTVAQDGTPLTLTDSRAGTIFGVSGPSPTSPTLSTVTFGAFNVGRAQMCNGASYGSITTSGGIESRLGGASGGPGYLSASAICAPPAIGNGFGYGNSGVGIVLGPPQFNWDLSLVKTTRITERQTIQLRTEFFNAFNHPQFNNPGTAISTAATFGVITSESVNPRLIQFALKYSF